MFMEKKIRVLVVDDQDILRDGVTRMLNRQPDLEVVGEASEGRTAVQLTHQLLPDVVIMDVSMPVMNGIESTRAIHAELPDVQVIGHSLLDEVEGGVAMRQAGAVDYVYKLAPLTALIAAIRACSSGSALR